MGIEEAFKEQQFLALLCWLNLSSGGCCVVKMVFTFSGLIDTSFLTWAVSNSVVLEFEMLRFNK